MIEKVIGGLGSAAIVYLLVDFFLWNGGILDPAILTRLAAVG